MSILLIMGVSSALAVMAILLSTGLMGRLATVLAALLWLAAVASILILGFS